MNLGLPFDEFIQLSDDEKANYVILSRSTVESLSTENLAQFNDMVNRMQEQLDRSQYILQAHRGKPVNLIEIFAQSLTGRKLQVYTNDLGEISKTPFEKAYPGQPSAAMLVYQVDVARKSDSVRLELIVVHDTVHKYIVIPVDSNIIFAD